MTGARADLADRRRRPLRDIRKAPHATGRQRRRARTRAQAERRLLKGFGCRADATVMGLPRTIKTLAILITLAAVSAEAALHYQRVLARQYGRETASHLCVREAVDLLDPSSLLSRIVTPVWLEGCLETASYAPRLCEELPSEGDDFSSWEARTCRNHSSRNGSCPGFGRIVRDSCRAVTARRREAGGAELESLLAAVSAARQKDPSGPATDRALSTLADHYVEHGDVLGAVIAYRDLVGLRKDRGEWSAAFAAGQAALRRLRPLGGESEPATILLTAEAHRPLGRPLNGTMRASIVGPDVEGLMLESTVVAWRQLPDRLQRHGQDARAFGKELRAGLRAWSGVGNVRPEFGRAVLAYALGQGVEPKDLSEIVVEVVARSLPGTEREVRAGLLEVAEDHGSAEQRAAVLVGVLNAAPARPDERKALYRELVSPREDDPVLREALDRGLLSADGRPCHALAERGWRWFRRERSPTEARRLLELFTRDLVHSGCAVHAHWLQDHILSKHPGIPSAI